jgi:lysophospholipase L1-like esterase
MNKGFLFFTTRTLSILVFLIIAFYTSPYIYYFVRGMHLTYRGDRINKHYYVGDPTKPKLMYVIMGDSTALGTGVTTKEQTYPYMIAKALADQGHYVEVKNIARNGAGVTAVLEQQFPQLEALEPNIITLTAAANDVTHFTSTKEFKQSLEALFTKLNALPNAKITIANTPNMGNTPAIPPFLKLWAYVRSVDQNKIFDATIKQYPLKTADLFTKGNLAIPTPVPLYAADNFHPNAAGYAIWAKVFIDALNK